MNVYKQRAIKRLFGDNAIKHNDYEDDFAKAKAEFQKVYVIYKQGITAIDETIKDMKSAISYLEGSKNAYFYDTDSPLYRSTTSMQKEISADLMKITKLSKKATDLFDKASNTYMEEMNAGAANMLPRYN